MAAVFHKVYSCNKKSQDDTDNVKYRYKKSRCERSCNFLPYKSVDKKHVDALKVGLWFTLL